MGSFSYNIVVGSICRCASGDIGEVEKVTYNKKEKRLYYYGTNLVTGGKWQSVEPTLLGYVVGVSGMSYWGG